MKTCSRCKQEKPRERFSKASRSTDGLNAWCKDCFKAYERARYANGDRERKERNKAASVDRGRAFLWKVLTEAECADCGLADPLVLEFDHRDPSEKSANISELIPFGIARIKREIDKCDIVCANCHRRRTIKQFGMWRGMQATDN